MVEETISAAEANRKFSLLLRQVREGRTFVVTSHGRPVARLGPIEAGDEDHVRERARDALLARLRQQPIVAIGPWTRDELYEDEP